MFALSTPEEYAARIVELQQACLMLLKEDLADWFNRIFDSNQVTALNFMDKLDNGVIICKLAKTISIWCKDQISKQNPSVTKHLSKAEQISSSKQQYQAINNSTQTNTKLRSAHQSNNHSFTLRYNSNYPNNENKRSNYSVPAKSFISSYVTPVRLRNEAYNQPTTIISQASSKFTSVNCISSSANVAPGYKFASCNDENQRLKLFVDNLIRMTETKIWEEAKCRTFFARDNVCHFIEWSREFGVNQSTLFETDDLVLHANPRQVVLCLLDVARIACIQHAFVEAPGLVKFEQEIDKELAASTDACSQLAVNGSPFLPIDVNTKRTLINSHNKAATVDDDGYRLIPANKTSENSLENGLKNINLLIKNNDAYNSSLQNLPNTNTATNNKSCDDTFTNFNDDNDYAFSNMSINMNDVFGRDKDKSSKQIESIDDDHNNNDDDDDYDEEKTPFGFHLTCNRRLPTAKDCSYDGDNNEQVNINGTTNGSDEDCSSLQSSLLSSDGLSQRTDVFTSDLDGKVMRIAKSYCGKQVNKSITRLSEGKYRIADRIVFVRLLKGQHVMVRIGGGWDTLQNFLFRHKSNPSQVIDVDDILPEEMKLMLEKNGPQLSTPNSNQHYSQQRTKLVPLSTSSNSSSSSNSYSHSTRTTNSKLPVSLHRVTPNSASSRYDENHTTEAAKSLVKGSKAFSTNFKKDLSDEKRSARRSSDSTTNVYGPFKNLSSKITEVNQTTSTKKKSTSNLQKQQPLSFKSTMSLNANSHTHFGFNSSLNRNTPNSTSHRQLDSSVSSTYNFREDDKPARYPNYLKSSQHITSRQNINTLIPHLTTSNIVVSMMPKNN